MANSNIKLNDEFVAPKLPELLALKIGRCYIDGNQVEAVKRILEIEGDDFENLTAKRNSVVKLLATEDSDDAAWNTMSGVTAVIDSKLMTMRGL